MKRTVRILAALFAAVFCFGGVSVAAESLLYEYPAKEDDTVLAPSAILCYVGIKPESDVVIYEKDADKTYEPGGLIQPAVLGYAMECIRKQNLDLDKTTGTFTLDMFNNYVSGTGLQVASMKIGETWKLRDLLTYCAIQTAADAAVTLAETVAGSVESFVDGMNGYAKKIGCKTAHFTNVTGLNEDGQCMSARDVMLCMRHAMEDADLSKILLLSDYTALSTDGERKHNAHTSNEMVRQSSPYYYTYSTAGRLGGSLTENGAVERCSKDGYEYLLVLFGEQRLNDKDEPTGNVYKDARRLFRWALLDFTYQAIVRKEEPVSRIPVKYSSERDSVSLVPVQDLATVTHNDMDLAAVTRRVICDTETLKAPVKKGERLGKLELYYDGKQIGTVDLITGEDASFDFIHTVWTFIKTFFTSVWLWLGILLVLVIFVGYIWLYFRYNRKKKKSGRPKRK